MTIHVIGGGTFNHVRAHLALAAPAFGGTAKRLANLFQEHLPPGDERRVRLHLTKMADPPSPLVTNYDVGDLIERLVADPDTTMIVMSTAMTDYLGFVDGLTNDRTQRLVSRDGRQQMTLMPAPKVLSTIRQLRKDIYLVGFKTTAGATPQEQYLRGLDLLKSAHCNLVLANDVVTRLNMVVVPEEARYHVTTDREEVLRGLVDMALARSRLRFTRSQVERGKPVAWRDERVPATLRQVVEHCVDRGAYKAFRGATAGHFAVKIGPQEFLTSIRKSDFNVINQTGLVRVETLDDDRVIAYGAKPSVGGQSQRIVFAEHPEYDCIVHFHCPLRPGSAVPVRSQREFECGSHECGQNTSSGLKKFGALSAVYLDQHGPNVVFHRSIDPRTVIDFIESNFDLASKTGGLVADQNRL